ncbi:MULTISPECIES: hypothetical protein [unclassified Psychrobacter]|uniref:hypothetical protein n=1 Tax=unclassified Psychrobacter TaxID=196806 RepID=UPI0025DECE56|nr:MULTISPECIES: hypothetical protein [unclassified Psychrobacter]
MLQDSIDKPVLRGQELNKAIESELQLMLDEGYDISPITHKSLYDRLKSKGYIRGKISTLSSRKELISGYMTEQIESNGFTEREKQIYVNGKSNKALLEKNKRLEKRIQELECLLDANTEILINIIQEVKLRGKMDIDLLLAPHLLRNHKVSK